jgi:hypothetical protein
MGSRPWARHVIGIGIATAVSIGFLALASRRLGRDVSIAYLIIVFVPLGLWAIPAFLRGLTIASLRVHRATVRDAGFYIRIARARRLTFTQTVAMALGPAAIDLLILAQVLYIQDSWDVQFLRFGILSFVLLFLLAGLVTALPPGAWLLAALDVRHVDPARGTSSRAADLYERALGPIGAVATLGTFITLMAAVGLPYDAALFLLAVWMARLLPPVLSVTAVYRFVLEPRILPRLREWCDAAGIPEVTGTESVLERLRSPDVPERTVDAIDAFVRQT